MEAKAWERGTDENVRHRSCGWYRCRNWLCSSWGLPY